MIDRPSKPDPDQKLLQVLEQIEAHLSDLRRSSSKSGEDWLTVMDAADELKVSRDTVERLISSGRIRVSEITTKAGKGLRRRYRIRRDWLEAYLMEKSGKRHEAPVRRTLRPKTDDIDFIGD